MTFFTDRTPFTHYGRFYGFPCYFAFDHVEGPTVVGTNVVWDWCVEHVVPWAQWACECLMYMATNGDYESPGFQIDVRGELPKRR